MLTADNERCSSAVRCGLNAVSHSWVMREARRGCSWATVALSYMFATDCAVASGAATAASHTRATDAAHVRLVTGMIVHLAHCAGPCLMIVIEPSPSTTRPFGATLIATTLGWPDTDR